MAAADHGPASGAGLYCRCGRAGLRILFRGVIPCRTKAGPQTPDCRYGQDPLGAAAAVAPQQHPAVGVQGRPQAAIHPLHPGPRCEGRRHQTHGEAHHLGAAHRGQIREVGRGGPPAHIGRCRGGFAEVQTLHQHVGVHHQSALAADAQQGRIIGKLSRWCERSQAANQLRFAKVRQGLEALRTT